MKLNVVTIHQAKSKLSQLLRKAANGEDVIIYADQSRWLVLWRSVR